MIFTRRSFLGTILATTMLPRNEPQGPPPRILVAQKTTLRLLPSPMAATTILGFDGTVPGSLLRCKLGDEMLIRLVNQTDQPLTLANWGLRGANAFDGVAPLTQAPIKPGDSFDYRLKPPDAGFFGYRSLVVPDADNQLRHGLYGGLIVDEPTPPAADTDLVAVLADWQLDAKSQIIDAAKINASDASLATINSKPLALEETHNPGSRIRLRILNATATRLFFVFFDGVKPFVLAVDGQPCATAFSPAGNLLPIGPGARFDVMFDLPANGESARVVLRQAGLADQPLITFQTKGTKWPDMPPPAALPQNPLLPTTIRLQDAKNIQLVVAGGGTAPFSLNGAAAKTFDATPLFSIGRGKPVTIALVNKSTGVQQMRFHGHAIRLLHDLDDGWDPFWRDSVIVPPGHTKHVAFVADNPGKWAIELIPLDVPPVDMVSWFEVS
jgi:FtsP/CotA-like multicopper oxidase with cupredoxin domain